MRMRKRIRELPLSLTVIVCSASLLFAQQPPPAESPPNNTFTMTTYYPAPFGAYKKLTVSDSVGIGTTSPSQFTRLHVVRDGDLGQVILSGETDPAKRLYLGYDTTGNFAFLKATQEGVSIRNLILERDGGSVGIGTTGPRGKLDVAGDIFAAGQVGEVTILSGRDVPPGLILRGQTWTSGSAVRPIQFQTLDAIDGSFQTRMLISTNGNVGIGTTGPNAPLDVFKSDSSATNNPGNPAIRVTATTGANSEFLSLGYDATLNRGYIQAAQAGVAWRDLLLNPKDGNVGIGVGTTSPSAKLEVNGNINLSGGSPTYRITNVADPVANSDVATKAYVDAQANSSFNSHVNSCVPPDSSCNCTATATCNSGTTIINAVGGNGSYYPFGDCYGAESCSNTSRYSGTGQCLGASVAIVCAKQSP